MKEKLIIKNFGPIKSVELDLGRFNILIGEQATGKSTVAKVLAVCRYFSYIIGDDKEFWEEPFENGLTLWGLKESIQADTYIHYKCQHYSITLKRIVKEVEDDLDFNIFSSELIPISDEFKRLVFELEKITPQKSKFPRLINDIKWTVPTSFFLNDVKNVLDNPFYLPTQRGLQSIFSLGQSSIQNISDSLFNQLAKMDGIARHFTSETYIEPLDIYYKNVRGHGYIRKANESEYYSLFNAASGYQSIIPIVLIIKYYTEVKKKRKTFLIEELEQNLFPTAQNKVVQYLVEHTVHYNSNMLLTTQSPYILTSLNNMMYAYQMGEIDEQRTAGIIEKKYWINPTDVSAYMMNAEGGCEDIIDREEGMIRSEKIDGISKTINREFNEMMNIELDINEAAK